MRRSVARTSISITVVVLIVAWITTRLSDSPWVFAAVGLVLVAGAAIAGVQVAGRLSAAYRAVVRRDQAVALASHELRTPITALRLSLEDLTLWKNTPPDVADELHRSISELDRLADAVSQMLDEHREDHRESNDRVDVADLATAAVDRWRAVRLPPRGVRIDAPPSGRVQVDSASFNQILTAMLDEFYRPEDGDVAVEVTNLGRTVRIRIVDQSPQVRPSGVIHGEPSGKEADQDLTLLEAAGLAESLGGYLSVPDIPMASLALILPACRA